MPKDRARAHGLIGEEQRRKLCRADERLEKGVFLSNYSAAEQRDSPSGGFRPRALLDEFGETATRWPASKTLPRPRRPRATQTCDPNNEPRQHPYYETES